jgi:predicted Zn-dependent peptidase
VTDIASSTLANDLPLHRVSLPGTRAVTILVAFDAGARTERPEENGMAHFLEHLVFKGGEKYDDYRAVNETAERLGAVLNAYTSHDLVAFHITCRAEVAPAAIDLLTDFVGRPRIDAAELDRERGVVIQEIARAQDQPSVVAEHLIDKAAFGDHPLGRTVLGPAEHLRTFTREAIVAFRERQWAGARGGAFLVGNLESLPADDELAEQFGRFPDIRSNGSTWEPAPPFEPRTLIESRDSNQSHLRMSYRPDVDPKDARRRAALTVYSTLLGGSMGSRLFDEIREQRGLAYSVYSVEHAFADVPILQLSAGLESGKAVEAFQRMNEIVGELRADGPTTEEFERARAYSAGRRVLGFENTNAVARHAAHQTVVYGQDVDPDAAIAALDEVTVADVAEVARGISEELSVACVGPHTADEFAL